ncbi:MAG: transglycosylase domain-containing protein [Xanthomonadales bacterium]|nr:transglycosylase domain-containing protein [Xanthomonadales bacterium]
MIDPARIATLYGKARQERRLVKINEVPPLFLRTLLAVEDKDFATHHGIDPGAWRGRCSSTWRANCPQAGRP